MIGVFFAVGFLADSQLEGLIFLAFIPFFAIQIKRSRDIGWSGWLSLLSLVPLAQWIWWIVLGTKGGKQEEHGFYSERDKESYQEREDSNFKEEEAKKENDSFQDDIDKRIITCPSCKQKLRIRLPLHRNISKCIKCSTKFELRMDESGYIYITKLDEKGKSHGDESEINTIDNCFEILEISQNSTPTEIKSAYRKRMMEYHPDKVDKLGSKLKKTAEEESKKLNTAYSILKENGYV